MSKIIPQNAYVLCKKIDEVKIDSGNIQLPGSNSMSIFQILDIGRSKDIGQYNVNDKVIYTSTGTKITKDDKDYYLLDSSKIIAKIID